MAAATLAISACSTTTTIDEYRESGVRDITLGDNEKMVILGRRHLGDHETEPGLISCIGKRLNRKVDADIIEEPEFLNQLYPWFEPRTAPLKLRRMQVLMGDEQIANQIAAMGVRYMVWVDGNTETTDSNGSLSCTLSPAGGGCFGFATWDRLSSYEAIIWDIQEMEEKGRVRVDTEGTSYLVAVVAPVPFIAQVQSEACEGMGNQLATFFDGEVNE
ncbi:hypothetical protein KFE80_06920 [bacterium SCSIO 12696]|nr:hypothetical protein KFE80_06920 [bacterium SCSIO 12696]